MTMIYFMAKTMSLMGGFRFCFGFAIVVFGIFLNSLSVAFPRKIGKGIVFCQSCFQFTPCSRVVENYLKFSGWYSIQGSTSVEFIKKRTDEQLFQR
jgi:hypothetical protein